MNELNKNDRVIVISECQSKGYIGKIRDFFYNGNEHYATVDFEVRLPYGSTCQPYNVKSLGLIDSKCTETKQKLEMINGYYIVEVLGIGRNTFFYKCKFDVNVGDKVVCEDENYIQKVVGINNIETMKSKNPTKEVVCVIDYSEINARKEREKELQRIKSELDKKVKQIQSKIDYEFYASKDSEVAELLNKMNELRGDK